MIFHRYFLTFDFSALQSRHGVVSGPCRWAHVFGDGRGDDSLRDGLRNFLYR